MKNTPHICQSGHIARMPDYCLPKRVFFGELCSGDRSRGRPRKRYKDTLKVSLKRCEIEPESWEHVAQDRATWRNLVKQGVSKYEQEFIDQNIDKHRRRKGRFAGPHTDGQSFLGFVYVPLSYFPGIPFPDGRFPGNPGNPGKYNFFAVYIHNCQQTHT